MVLLVVNLYGKIVINLLSPTTVGLIIYVQKVFIGFLIIGETPHLRNVLGQPDDLVTVTIFIIVPNVKHSILPVVSNNGRFTVIYGGSRTANDIASNSRQFEALCATTELRIYSRSKADIVSSRCFTTQDA